MKLKLFEFAVLFHPTDKEFKDGGKTLIIVNKQTMLGKDDKQVGMKAVMEIPAEYKEKLDQVEIIVRPF